MDEKSTDNLQAYLDKRGITKKQMQKARECTLAAVDAYEELLEAEKSIEEGHTTTYEAIRKNIKDKYGI